MEVHPLDLLGLDEVRGVEGRLLGVERADVDLEHPLGAEARRR